ncbi:porin [Rhodoblastus acidophilus]|uniref:Porin n=1 Tax=Rhodoblastus acidophilus TaxID=1074 RepID=A0A6N8DMQ9_RHOAC|nr:porin [Rhodoblastus acidophilus]MCW2274261.1 putative porin [Rhodoblastus acidophilus]MTV30825.1 porin [Rhodoblastus acidophilus]
MKTKWMAAVAAAAVLTASGVARAEDGSVTALRAQATELKKQNAALEKRLSKLETQQAADASASPTDFLAQVTKGPLPVVLDDGPICWKGICINGAIDGGLSYASHGAPLNSKYYNGNEMITKAGNRPYFGFNPNGLGNSQVGVKGSVELIPDWAGVFTLNTYFNPQSGQLQNAPGSLVDNSGVPLISQSQNGDGSRGGQAFNDQANFGVSSKTFGTLTFGRHRTLNNDLFGAYDPTGGAPAFSFIGYSGSFGAGLGFTGDSRWDNSLKYKVTYGPVRFGAMYKFVDGNSGSNAGNANTPTVFFKRQNDAAQFDVGFSYAGFDVDGVIGYFNQAINSGALNTTQLRGVDTLTLPGSSTNVAINTVNNSNAGTLSGTAADTTGGSIGAKYTWNQWKFYGGWSHMIFHNPKNPVGIGSQNDQGGYVLSSVNNNAYPNARLLDVEWFGVKYAWDPKTDIIAVYEHANQNSYGSAATQRACNTNNRSSGTCAGTMNQASLSAVYHFTKRFDVYGGVSWSTWNGGFSNGSQYSVNWAPTVGARFTF